MPRGASKLNAPLARSMVITQIGGSFQAKCHYEVV